MKVFPICQTYSFLSFSYPFIANHHQMKSSIPFFPWNRKVFPPPSCLVIVNTIPLKDLTIGNILGSGNFADVHKGYTSSPLDIFNRRYMDHDVAIKIYKKTPEGKDLTGFQREVIIQSKLNHKNIIKVILLLKTLLFSYMVLATKMVILWLSWNSVERTLKAWYWAEIFLWHSSKRFK